MSWTLGRTQKRKNARTHAVDTRTHTWRTQIRISLRRFENRVEEGGERRGKVGQQGQDRDEEGGQGKAECIRGAAGEVSASTCECVSACKKG